jgi:hypothetical protein
MFDLENVRVYHDSDTSRYHFDQLPNLRFNDLNYYTFRLDDFINSTGTKVAGFHVPFPAETTWLNRLQQVYDQCIAIYIFCSELHDSTVSQLKTLNLPKINLFVCGTFNFSFQSAKVYHWLDWFYTSSYFYTKTNPGFLDDKIFPYAKKPKSFDVLLGNQREHRDLVFNYINENALTDRVIMTYVYYANKSLLNNSNFILETTGVEFDTNRNYNHSIESIKYYGRYMTLSQLIPLQVYNQTAYSIVAETNFNNTYNFYTEKIVKPILARRLFIAIAGKNYLKNLRTIGFKTFDCVIDESYDEIEDNNIRWQAAMSQVKFLTRQPQEMVLEKIKDIVEYNYALLRDGDFYREFSDQLEQSLINNTKICPTWPT